MEVREKYPQIDKAAQTRRDNARAGAAPPLPRGGEPGCELPCTVVARPRYRATAGPQPKAARPQMSPRKGQVSRSSLARDGHGVALAEGDGIMAWASCSWPRQRPLIFLINRLRREN